MLELAFTVCLLAEPGQCEDRSLLFADVTMMQCVLGAQRALAPWAEENPKWKVESYRCRQLDNRITEL